MLRGLALAFSVSFFSCYLTSVPSLASPHGDGFLQCLTDRIPSELVYTHSSNNFTDVLFSSIKNPKFFTSATVRPPLCIVTPGDASHVQAAVVCGRRQGVLLRVRSGGHDYEGLSYRSVRPSEVFAVVDLGASLRAVRVNRLESTAWVDSGATIGELYYAIARNNSRVAFPAGECPTVGVGGHFSGGGIGMMTRKHGLAVDKIVDAKLVNADGDLLDRAGMGEGLFWAIRGGGGGSFGIVLSWKVQLVQVPPTVTVFNIRNTLDQGAVEILTRWQHVAPSLPSDLTIRVMIVQQGHQALFQALYLGACGALVATMDEKFPELGMTSADCQPMTWLQSAATPFISFASNGTLEEVLLDRTAWTSAFSKAKSDYVMRAIPKAAWKEIFSRWFAVDGAGHIILEPHGGFMGSIPAAATPYPHRNGVLYVVQYISYWQQGDGGAAAKSWIGGLYDFMGQHVTKNPRRAYVNFRDLDIGQNDDDSTFESAKVWGEQYFVGNYRRLALVKATVDPTNYFRNEQSIPPLMETTAAQVI